MNNRPAKIPPDKSLTNTVSNKAENLLRPSRRNARFPDLGPTQVSLLLDARHGSRVTTYCRVVDRKGADAAKGRVNSMKPREKLSKADLARVAERLRHSNPVNHFGFQLVKGERGRA